MTEQQLNIVTQDVQAMVNSESATRKYNVYESVDQDGVVQERFGLSIRFTDNSYSEKIAKLGNPQSKKRVASGLLGMLQSQGNDGTVQHIRIKVAGETYNVIGTRLASDDDNLSKKDTLLLGLVLTPINNSDEEIAKAIADYRNRLNKKATAEKPVEKSTEKVAAGFNW